MCARHGGVEVTMHRSIWVLLACVAPVGCHFEECWDDDGDWDDDHHCGCDNSHDGHDSHGSGGNAAGGAAGASPTGHMTGTGGQSDAPDSGTGPSASGGRPTTPPPPAPCSKEEDCEPGFNCDFTRGKCTPTDAETCGELVHEASCSVRSDCKEVYAGVNCSCGPDCHCVGGEAGCICERFEFFRCEPADPH